MTYRFARRSFLRGIGASVGLRAFLRNIEASAQGMTRAPRLLVAYHPVGTIRPYWVPTGSGTSYTVSPLLKPFTDKGLRNEMAILFGLNNNRVTGPGGGSEKGVVAMMTGAPVKNTRSGQAESDDPCADAPSMDQVFGAKALGLQGRPIKSLQVICDDRVDFQEISARCMSYGYEKVPVGVIGGTGYLEAKPLRPVLRPSDVYAQVFGGIMPGNPDLAALNRARRRKKSVLDFSLRELRQLRTLAPASEKARLDAHEAAVRQVENAIATPLPETCMSGPAPAAGLVGGIDDGGNHNHYGNPQSAVNDRPVHEAVARAHFAVIKGAFACDLTRVATFQFSPSTNHVSFGGLWPTDPSLNYMHHPVSHSVTTADRAVYMGTTIPASPSNLIQFLVAVEQWYNALLADFLVELKGQTDVYGNTLLDQTVVPYLTESANPDHAFSPLPACVFGGRALGMVGGQFISLSSRAHNDMWYTCARAFGLTTAELRSDAESAKAWSQEPAVIEGLWAPPA